SCRILLANGDGIRLVHDAASDGPSTTVRLRPERPLENGTSYRLRCEGQGPVEGAEAVQADFEQQLRTYPNLVVARSLPEGCDAPSDEVTVEVEFSNPVTLDDVRERISPAPDVPAVARGYLDESGTVYRAVVDLTPETPYVLRLQEGLVDTYGQ